MPFRSYFENFATVEGFDDGNDNPELIYDNGVVRGNPNSPDNDDHETQQTDYQEDQAIEQAEKAVALGNDDQDDPATVVEREVEEVDQGQEVAGGNQDADIYKDAYTCKQDLDNCKADLKTCRGETFEDTVEGFNGGSHNDLLDQRLLLKSLLFGLLFYLLANNDTYKMTKQLTKGLDKVLIHAVVFSVFYYIIQTMI
tara:strand:+ start:13 stop:606 length:594 start_codon:yes stop_codon:yes gene_type:complete